MSPESLELVNHLKAKGAQTFEDLQNRFCSQERGVLNKRLHNLKSSRWIERYEEDGVFFWVLLEESRNRDPLMPRTRGIQIAPPKQPGDTPEADAVKEETPLPIVPPRRVDVMNGPTYQPTPTYIARPGALDATRIPSRGLRC